MLAVTLRVSAGACGGLAQPSPQGYNRRVGWLYIALLALAVVVLAGAEWPRLTERYGGEARRRRDRARRKASLTVIRTESDEFEESVRRDLAELPTIEERDRKR